MSPSRGARLLCRRLYSTTGLPQPTTTFAALRASDAPLQVYISNFHSPYANLALEHYLFTTLPPSTISLLFYTNTPAIVIGRNQNPWTETNHPQLLRTPHAPALVRRRSGGGTVYHDLGNLNYSASVPAKDFDRDTYAVLMAGALRSLGVRGATVNVRHDVVVVPPETAPAALKTAADPPPAGTRKVSGSAYKLTRLRSYHHGTMLLAADLAAVGRWLASPAAPFIAARGVSSVPSRVANTGVSREALIAAAVAGLAAMHARRGPPAVAVVGEREALDVPELRRGAAELQSPAWIYGQTPRFAFTAPGRVLPGPVEVDKGLVTAASPLPGLVGRRFGGGPMRAALAAQGEHGAAQWAEDVLGPGEWNVQYESAE